MTTETAVRVIVIVVFLLYAYFMIGGYTPCNVNDKIIQTKPSIDHFKNCGCHNNHNHTYDYYPNISNTSNTLFEPKKTIYQNGPYLNI